MREPGGPRSHVQGGGVQKPRVAGRKIWNALEGSRGFGGRVGGVERTAARMTVLVMTGDDSISDAWR